MLEFCPPTPKQNDLFLLRVWDDGQEYMECTLRLMNMTWDEYSRFFGFHFYIMQKQLTSVP